MAIYAYIRVSTDHQTTDNQRKTIVDAGFSVNVFYSEDGVSGSIKALERPVFSKMMKECKAGDTVIVTMVDRLGRNAQDILHTVEEFKRLSIKLRVLQFDGVDITSSMGKLLVTLMSAFAELEKNTIVERINAGLARTKEAGTILGPPMKLEPKLLRQMCADKAKGDTLDVIAARYDMPRSSIARNIASWAGKMDEYEGKYIVAKGQYIMKNSNSGTRMKHVI